MPGKKQPRGLTPADTKRLIGKDLEIENAMHFVRHHSYPFKKSIIPVR